MQGAKKKIKYILYCFPKWKANFDSRGMGEKPAKQFPLGGFIHSRGKKDLIFLLRIGKALWGEVSGVVRC